MMHILRFVTGSLAAAGLIFGGATPSVAADAGKMTKTAPGIMAPVSRNNILYTCPSVIKLKTQLTSAIPVNMHTTGYASAGVDWIEMTFSEWKYDYNNTTKTMDYYGVYCINSAPKNGMTCQSIFMANSNGLMDCKAAGNTLNCTKK